MFQNMLMTGLTTELCSKDEIICWDNRPFASVWPETHPDSTKGPEIRKTIRKKQKRVRTAFTTDQLRTLEKTFLRSRFIDPESRRQLAASLNISDKSVKVWFQNRRMKQKKDSEFHNDSFTDTSSNATTPPLNTEQNSEVASSNCLYPAQFVNFESQYQVPYMQYENHIQFYEPPSILPQRAAFWFDTNVYPTEYYPCSEFNTAQYPEQNSWVNLDEFNPTT